MRFALALLMGLLAAPPAPAQGQPSAAPAEAASDCPAEELSCGKQVPVVSDGVAAFENDEMGLRAVFPAGSWVCLSRSGDAPRGFYAWYPAEPTRCPERGDVAAAYMGISSSFNALDHTSLRQASDDCRPMSRAVARRLRGATLSIGRHPSRACQAVTAAGEIELVVYAMGRGLAGAPPRVIYFASLGSSPERLDPDLAMFRTFLATLQVGLPEPPSQK